MKKSSIFISIAIALGLVNLGILYYQSNKVTNPPNLNEKEKVSEVRGMVVFQTYCVLCHGEKADGKGRLAVGKIPAPADLTKSALNDEQLQAIIRGGGVSVGRSEFMPPWGEELSVSQINDLVEYIHVLKGK